ncbi:hypothetical protein [Streptomyces geranii]|uniref:hypothetical protein n=1 Tax=Streptomyces geranii TaxID=2058923 RepID=UPI000D03002C|nr:hypothetical protein [Streptomyces geranii]
MRARTALLLVAAVPLTVTVAATALKAGHWRLTRFPYGIRLEPLPRPDCPDCRGEGGWWTSGPYPDMEACWCWAERREVSLRLLPRSTGIDEPPF